MKVFRGFYYFFEAKNTLFCQAKALKHKLFNAKGSQRPTDIVYFFSIQILFAFARS